jgi:NADH-quinone oxidoreductase subunit F
MDLHPIDALPTDDERDAIERVLARLAEAPPTRDLLLPVLRAIQARVGFVSKGALAHACERLQVPPAEAWGVATFYHLIATQPAPRTVLHVCDDVACRARGSERIASALGARFAPEGAALDDASWKRSPCLGQCERAPAALLVRAGEPVEERALGSVDTASALAALAGTPAPLSAGGAVLQPRASLRLLARVGVVDPESLDDYRAHGGYAALRRAHELGAAWVIRELSDAKLLGRGGAGFPAGRKWSAVAAQPTRPRYVVCNADESEPGTFKDRVLMEDDPFAIVEAITIAAFAVSAERAFVYVRGEYPLAAARLEGAIASARRRGLLGASVMGHAQRLDIEVRRGAGAYICGEETALLESLEGRRGEPRAKPPFPVEQGLFGKPTLINNVETLAAALMIVRDGAPAFTELGTPDSTGTRLFCLSGDVARPGIYEIPMGLSLRALIALAGGATHGVAGVLLGGAAGTFLGPDELDLALTFEDTRRAGATLGSGVVIVFREGTDFRAVLHGLAGFFRHESCGQCVPCRIGTTKVDELLARVRAGTPEGTWDDERERLRDLGHVLREASICGLGQTAASALESATKRFAIWPAALPKPHEGEDA